MRCETERLSMRAYVEGDAAALARTLADGVVAQTVVAIPYPYTLADARAFVERQNAERSNGTVSWAIEERASGTLAGGIALRPQGEGRAELGYWIAPALWNRGIATEAARAAIRYGFDERPLHRIEAHYLVRNPASRRVMEKAGMTYEGILRGFARTTRGFEDAGMCAILATDPR